MSKITKKHKKQKTKTTAIQKIEEGNNDKILRVKVCPYIHT